MPKICGIYKIVSPSGRIYIGQSIDIKKRFRAYKNSACKEQTLLIRSFKKYGFENHSLSILVECERDYLNDLEIFYINKFNSFNSKKGLNLKAGGQSGGICSELVKQKLRKPKSDEAKEKYRQAALKRPPVSQETKDKHRLRMLGNNHVTGKNWKKSKNVSQETKDKISEKQKIRLKNNPNKPHTPEHIEWLKNRMSGDNNPMSKKNRELRTNK